jgi:hypothetical protein
MTRRDAIGTLMGGVAATTFTGCSQSPHHKVRFRMTVEVETPEGLKTGSSVMEMSAWMGAYKFPGTTGAGQTFRGEAVAVDLPRGQTLFALVTNGYNGATQDVQDAIVRNLEPPGIPAGEKLVALFEKLSRPESIGRTFEVVDHPHALRPPLVRFRDIRDPTSVELVDPNDLTKSFGPGVKLKRIVLIVTDEPVTKEIGKRLAPMGIKPGHSLDRTEYPSGSKAMPKAIPLAQILGYSDFSRGIDQ